MSGTGGRTSAERVILYARVSSEEQAKKGYSLSGQLRELREHAAKRGHKVLAEVVDDGYEGDSLWRPGIDRVRRMVTGGGVDLVLATERDRIARKRGYAFVLEEEFREHDCALRALEDKEEDSAEERLMRAIKDDFAEYEHAKITRRTFSKKLEKARGGEIIAGRTPNYGFRYNERRNGYLIDEDKMALVRRVFEMIGEEGATSYAVVKWLESVDPHGPTGKGWNLPYIRNMVFNDVYKPHSFEEIKGCVSPKAAAPLDPGKRYGIWWFNRRRFEPKRTPPKTPGDFKRKYRPIPKPHNEWIGIPIPDPGIPASLIEAARTRVGKNKGPSKNGRRFWELSGNIVRCAECGYVMGTTSSGTPTNDYFYYRCRSKYNVKSGCSNGRGVRADILEREVWEMVSSALRRPVRLRAGLQRMIESRRKLLAAEPEKQIARWAAQIDKAKIKRARYQDQEAEGLMTREELRVRLAKLQETMELAEAEVRRLELHEEGVRELQRGGEQLLERYAKLLPDKLQNISGAERRRIYQMLQVEVFVPKEGDIRLRLPFLPDEESFCRDKIVSWSAIGREVVHCLPGYRFSRSIISLATSGRKLFESMMKSASWTSAFRASAMRFSMELAIASRARLASWSAIWKILRRSVSTSPRMGSSPPTVSLKRPIRRSSTSSTRSSTVPATEKLKTVTTSFWPKRSTRPIRCSTRIGFQGKS